MSLLDLIHGRLVFSRRVERLAAGVAPLLPPTAQVLDVGCGDGSVAATIGSLRPDVGLTGVDVLVRPETLIPVRHFDGITLPFDDDAFDVVLFIDVLHHTDHPAALLTEAARVARGVVIVKDHLTDGVFARPTLRFMDWIGNARHGVVLPYNYLSARQWTTTLEDAGLTVRSWQTNLELYPKVMDFIFGRNLHVLLDATPASTSTGSVQQ